MNFHHAHRKERDDPLALGGSYDPFAEFTRETYFNADSLAGLPIPYREWHVADLIPSGTVTLFGGDGGTGKSLAALQLAVSTALGTPWLGREVREGRALYISAEDDRDELHRRLADILVSEDAGFEDACRLTLRTLAGEDALLANLDKAGGLAPTPLFDDLDGFLDVERPALLVLDTLADLFPGNENDRAQARQFIGMLRGLAIRHRCAVVLLAHPSLTGMSSGTGASGSTGWNNSVRSRLYLERIASEGYEADPDARRLVVKKSNYGRTGAEIGLRWQDGVFVADAVESGLDRKATGAKAERVFLKLLTLFAEQERTVSPSPSVSYAPTVFAKHPEAEGMTKKALETAMNALFSAERIKVEKQGRASKERNCIVISEGSA